MSETEDRKDDHIRIIRDEDVEEGTTGFADVQLVHEALPEVHREQIDLSVDLCGKEISAPIILDSMTGGSENTIKINRRLAAAAEECNVAMGLGSQRAALELDDPDVLESYTVVRDAAPNAFIFGNLGAAQVISYDTETVEEAVEMIDADAMAVHLNFLQEAVQPEGDVDARGCLAAIERLADSLSVPIIVKETGNGISAETAAQLSDAGVDAINVAGRGGTTWSGVEAYRAAAVDDKQRHRVGTLYRQWGIPTVASTVEAASEHDCVIASGGVRSGLDIAKSIALGAQAGGLAKPLLKPASDSVDAIVDKIENLTAELRTAMFVTGSSTVSELQQTDTVILGRTAQYIKQRQSDSDAASYRLASPPQ